MRLVISQSRFKIDSRANSLKVTSNTMSEINKIPRRTGQRFTNIIRSTSSGRAKRRTRDKKVVYLAHCVTCNLQGVGSTVNFKSRLANYKSHIKYNKRTCSIVNHFIDVHGGDHSSLKFMLIDQHHDKVRNRENFWIGTLLSNLRGLNSSHDFIQQ